MRTITVLFILARVLQGVESTRIISLWFFLEIRTLIFLGKLIAGHRTSRQPDILKIFLIQSLRGISLLILILWKEFLVINFFKEIIIIVILFKIGAVPFHSWLLGVGKFLPWEPLFLFLTVIKILPCIFLINILLVTDWKNW